VENEMFTFVVLTTESHRVEHRYHSREQADRLFDRLTLEPGAISVAFYCASVGGCVNAWHA